MANELGSTEKLEEARAACIRDVVRKFCPTPTSGEWISKAHPTAPFDVASLKQINVKKYASPSDCKDCLTCGLHFEPEARQKYDSIAYTNCFNDAEAQSCISDLIRSIDEHHEYLQGKIKSHGDNLLKRWPKLDKTSRQKRFGKIELESKAWPQLARYYQYDWGWHEKRKYCNAFLIPHLNLEALSRSDARLLRLLHNRTIHNPADYFWDDLRSVHFPLSTGLLAKTFNPGCMITDGEQRGTMVPFDKPRLHREEVCGFPVAQLVLEAQNLLMQKLRAIVDELVKDLATGSGSKKWNEDAAKDFRKMDPNTADARLKYAILEQPYGPPKRFVVSELLDMIHLRHDILADELKELQQDPNYLQTTLLEMDGKRRMLDIDIVKNPKVLTKNPELSTWWEQASRNIWIWDYFRAIDWSELSEDLSTNVARNQAPASDSDEASQSRPSLGQDLPEEYAKALSRFCRRITCAFYQWIVPLAEDCFRQFPGVVKSPFHEKSGLTPYELHAEYISFGGRRRLFTKDRLLWALLELFCSMEVENTLDVGIILGVLAEEVQRPDQQARLSPKTLRLIDDLMSLYVLWRATFSQRPAFPKTQPAGSKTKAIFTLTLGTFDQGIVHARASRQLSTSIQELTPEFNKVSEDRPAIRLLFAWQDKWPKGQINENWLYKSRMARVSLYEFWVSRANVVRSEPGALSPSSSGRKRRGLKGYSRRLFAAVQLDRCADYR